MPLFIGMPAGSDWKDLKEEKVKKGAKKKAAQSVSLCVTLCCDPKIDILNSPPVCNAVASSWVSCNSFLPATYRESQSLAAWRDALAQVSEAPASIAAAPA